MVDEIVVVDSFSTDRTEEICRLKGARFFQHAWSGYAEQKNYANSLALHDTILSIDADEALSEELRDSILKVKDNMLYDGYSMNRLTNYCGKWIRHGSWYPDRKIRIFDRRKGRWEGAIHEEFIFEGQVKIQFLKGDLLHYSYFSIPDHIRQADHYTDITSKLAFDRGKRSNLVKIIFSPVIKSIRDYFLLLGFLDGYYGMVVCRISAKATFLKYVKLRRLQRRGSGANR